MPLFQDRRETVRLEHWMPGAEVDRAARGGIEVLVLDGRFGEGGESFEPQSWLRLPNGARLEARAVAGRLPAWVKAGHLLHDQPTAPRPPETACESWRVDIDSPQTRH